MSSHVGRRPWFVLPVLTFDYLSPAVVKYRTKTVLTKFLPNFWSNYGWLNGHKNPINGFRPTATHPSTLLCFLRAFASWPHQSMTGLPGFDLSNECKVVLFADCRRPWHQIFGGHGGTKVNKFLDCLKSIVIGHI